jgi:hypothetical protein
LIDESKEWVEHDKEMLRCVKAKNALEEFMHELEAKGNASHIVQEAR